METDEVQINVWLSRWQCIFSLDTGMFYTVFLIVSYLFGFLHPLHIFHQVFWGVKVMVLQLHRVGDWYYHL